MCGLIAWKLKSIQMEYNEQRKLEVWANNVLNTFPWLANIVSLKFKSFFTDYIPLGYFSKMSRGRCQIVYSDNKAKHSWTELGKLKSVFLFKYTQ